MKYLQIVKSKALKSVFYRGGGFLSAFFLSISIAYNLSIEDAGLFFWGLAIISAATTVSALGVGQHIVRTSAYKTRDGDVERDSFIGLAFIGLVIFSFILVICIYFLDAAKHELLLYLLPSLFFIGLATPLTYALQGRGYITISIVLLTIFVPLSVAVSTFLFDSAFSLAMFRSIASFVLCIVTILIFAKIGVGYRIRFYNIKKTFVRARSLWIVAICLMTLQWGGQIIAGTIFSSNEVAQLALAQRLSMVLGVVLIGINLYVSPKLAIEYKSNGFSDKLANIYYKTIFVSLIPSVLILIVVIIALPHFVDFLGSDYYGIEKLIYVFMIGQMFNTATGSAQNLLNMTSHDDIYRNSVFLSVLIFFILLMPVINYFGLFGMAMLSALSISTQNFICAYNCFKLLNQEKGVNNG